MSKAQEFEQDRRPVLSRGFLAGAYLALLLVTSLVLDFADGGYVPEVWLAAAMLVAFLVFALTLSASLPAFPSRGAAVVLALLLAYVIWMGLSAAWALSVHRTWLELARGLFFVLVLGLGLIFVRDLRGRWPLMLLACAAVIAFVPVLQLLLRGDISGLFLESRLYYPISYPNGAAALYLVPFWPLLGLAAARQRGMPWRAAALGVASMLLGLALMTQSRGALYAFIITALLLLAVAPLRLRALLFLTVPVALTAWSFETLNRYWAQGADQVPGTVAANRLLLMGLAAAAAAVVFSLLERVIGLSPRSRIATGGLLVVLLAGLLLFGGDRVPSPGDVWENVETGWAVFTESADQPRGSDESRFLRFTSSGRWDLWRVAWRDFLDQPLRGVGAGSYLYTHERLRTQELATVQEAHSLQLGALAETGLVGFALLAAFGLGGLALAMRKRLHLRLSEEERGPLLGTVLALMGFAYWFIHAAVDWLWHIPGVTMLALLLLAGALAKGGKQEAPYPVNTTAPESRSRKRWGADPLRALALLLAGFTLLATGLPYLSVRFQQVAIAQLGPQPILGSAPTEPDERAGLDGEVSARAQDSLLTAGRAARLTPYDPEPHLIRGLGYRAWALAGHEENRRLLGLALAHGSHEKAIEIVPADWRGHFRAALAALELAEAKRAAEAGDEAAADGSQDGDLLPADPAVAAAELPGVTQDSLSRAADVLALNSAELRQLAEEHLAEARRRNPLYERLKDLGSAVSGNVE